MGFWRTIRNVKGAVFVISMSLSLLMILMAAAASNMLLNDARMIRRLKLSTAALYVAEAGASVAMAGLAANSTTGWSPSGPTGGTLGTEGSYTYSISKTGTRWLVTSTGTVRGVSRTVSAEVKNLYPPAMHYVLVSGGDINLDSVGGLITVGGDIHANDDMDLRATAAGSQVDINAESPASGKATCSGNYCWPSGSPSGNVTIDDSANSGGGKDSIEMPSFDFGYLRSVAETGGGNFVAATSGFVTYNDGATISGGTAGLTYVNDDVRFNGHVTINGGFVARGDIRLTFGVGNVITQVLTASDEYPVFMSQEGNEIQLHGVFNAAGVPSLIYATNNIDIYTPGGTPTVLGTVIAGGSLTTTANAPITLTYSQVTAPKVVPKGLEVVSWNK